MKVQIHYCHEWNYEGYAASLAKEVTTAFGSEVEVETVPEFDGEGNLDVFVDNFVLFSSRTSGRFLEEGEIVALLRQ